MGEFQPLVDMLDDQRLEALAADDLGVLSLREVVDVLRRVRRELEAADSLAPDEITSSVRSNMLGGGFANSVEALLSAMDGYGEQTQDPQGQRTQFKAQAEALWETAVQQLRPLVRVDETKVAETLARLDRMAETLAAATAASEAQTSALAGASATTAASDLAEHYKSEADGHAGTARRFLYASGAAAVVLTALTVWFLLLSPPDFDSDKTSEQWIEVVRGLVGRLALLSIAGFAVAFCARNYRVNRHLEVLNRRRENALNTFGLLQAAVTSEDARNIVVGELVRSVFTSEETGYLSEQTERTIIESPGGAGMLTAMSAVARGTPQSS